MPRDTVTPQSRATKQTTTLTDLTFTASDAVNFEQVAWSDGLYIIWRNSDGAVAYDVTLEAAPDSLGRDVDCLTELAAGDIAMTGLIEAEGWRQSDGYVYFKAENAAILYAVVKVR
jgi:hypothetical protein